LVRSFLGQFLGGHMLNHCGTFTGQPFEDVKLSKALPRRCELQIRFVFCH
jgi:hypothetical protein